MPNSLYDRLFQPLVNNERPLLCLGDHRWITADTFHDTIATYGNYLRSIGVLKGDRVAVQVEKSPEALAVYAATVAIGAVFLPLNTAYTARETRYFVENATPAVLICDPARQGELAPVAQEHGARLATMDRSGQGSFADGAKGQPSILATRDCDDEDLAAILYTSGTTGRSKGAMLTHGNLLSNAEVLARHWCFTPDDVLLHCLPIFHTHGLFVASNVALVTGGKMIFLAGFDLNEVFHHLPAATAMMGVPTFYTRMLDDLRLTRDSTAHMRLFVSGSAPLLAETHLQWQARTGHAILERYGMTETNMNASNPYRGARRAGTVGLPLPGVEVRVRDMDRDCPMGEVGGIEVRGPNVFKGYWQMPEKTAEDLRPDGWFITGDLGRFDQDGYLQIVGRAKDLVITGGFNVYPIEVEMVLDAIDGIKESAVIGVPHPDFGEAVFAVLVPTPGVVPDLDMILGGLKTELARFKQPKAAVVLDELPRNAMGKVQKAALRDRFKGWFTPG